MKNKCTIIKPPYQRQEDGYLIEGVGISYRGKEGFVEVDTTLFVSDDMPRAPMTPPSRSAIFQMEINAVCDQIDAELDAKKPKGTDA